MTGFRTLGIIAATLFATAACDVETDADETFPGAETATENPAATDDAATRAEAPAALIRVDSMGGSGAAYLTDVAGRALYLLEGEPADSSTCYDACAEEWPPLLASAGAPEASGPVQANLIGTIERRDGAAQVTYAGHPLYYYHDDQGPGETTGQDVTDQWGEWYLVSPSGEAVEHSGS